MPSFIPPPEWSDGGSTILTGDDKTGALVLQLQCADIDRRSRIINAGPRWLESCLGHRALAFQHVQACTLRNAVVKCRAATAPLSTACAITPPSSGACSCRHLICRNVRCASGGVWQERQAGLGRKPDGRRPRVAGDQVGRALEVRRSSRVPRLQV